MKRQLARIMPALMGVLLLTSVALAACGEQGHAASAGRTGPAISGDVLYVVDGGSAASQDGYGSASSYASERDVAAVSAASGGHAPLFSLPMGLTTLDHQRLYAATNAGGRTTIMTYDTPSGARLGAFDIAGSYSVAAQGYTGGVLTPDGRWLVLRAITSSDAATTFALVDTQARRLAQTIALPGSFDLDAISPGGGMLYLLQYVNDTQHHYYVRAYDLRARHLLDAIIVDKTEIHETKMQGSAVARQMSSDGSMAYTLYINRAQNHAFVHILPLGDTADSPPFARCVDLPSGTNPDLLHFYSLALSPDGATLYATNGALGLVSTISLHGQDIYSDQVARTARFNPATNGATAADGVRALYNGAALAADLSGLYVVGLRGIWAIRLSDLAPRKLYAGGQAFTGVALSSDATRLYAADPARGVLLIPLAARAGATERTLPASVRSPWGIAWVTWNVG